MPDTKTSPASAQDNHAVEDRSGAMIPASSDTRAEQVSPDAPATSGTRASAWRIWRWPLLFAGVIVLAVAFAWLQRPDMTAAKVRLLPVDYARVPPFKLLASDGRVVTREDLLGNIWIASFIFTRCGGPCPKLSLRMNGLQRALEDYPDDVKIVSFSVDPEFDTPRVLRDYAGRFKADADRWWLLTGGDQASMHTLVKRGFFQAVSPATGGSPLVHSERVVIVDRRGRIRGFYGGLEPDATDVILGYINRLLEEPAP